MQKNYLIKNFLYIIFFGFCLILSCSVVFAIDGEENEESNTNNEYQEELDNPYAKYEGYDDCSYAYQGRLNSVASSVKSIYLTNISREEYEDEIQGGIGVEVHVTGKLQIYNVTDEIYVIVKDNDENRVYTSGEVNGEIIEIDIGELDEVKVYEIEVYPVNAACNSDAIRTIKTVVPRYNGFNAIDLCQENPDFYYCQEFTTLENFSYDTFMKNYYSYIATKTEEEEEGISIIDTISENHIIFEIVLTVLIVFGYISIRKYRERKKIGL